MQGYALSGKLHSRVCKYLSQDPYSGYPLGPLVRYTLLKLGCGKSFVGLLPMRQELLKVLHGVLC